MSPAKTQQRIEDGSEVDLVDFVGKPMASSVLVKTCHAHNYFDAGEFQKDKNLPQNSRGTFLSDHIAD